MEQRDEGLHQSGVSVRTPPLFGGFQCGCLLKLRFSLTYDPDSRPTPKEALEHRWIVGIMKTEVPMAKWIAQVWGWSIPRAASRRQQKSEFLYTWQFVGIPRGKRRA